ncbi:MAG: hypothetical protein WKG07_22795 [Hymenobacter sp.]
MYPATPAYRSELVNRTNLSVPILTARKNFIRPYLRSGSTPSWIFRPKATRPKKPFTSAAARNRMHRILGGEYTLTAPTDATFLPLWEASEAFLQRSQDGHLKVRELMDVLTAAAQAQAGLRGFLGAGVPVYEAPRVRALR